MNPEFIIQKVPLFAHLKKEYLDQLASRTHLLSFKRGESIIEEGSHDDRLFIVTRGRVTVVKGLGLKSERKLKVLEGYVHFGEMSLIDDLSRSASVVAESDVEVLTLDKGAFRELIRADADIAFDLLKSLSRRLRAMNQSISETLGTLAPVCVACHKIRDQDGRWVPIEQYVSNHSELESNRSICPRCSKDKYQKFYSR